MFTGIIGCLLCSGIIAQDIPKQWTLEECIRYAIAHNISLKQSVREEESRKIELNTSLNSWLPNLNASVNQNFGFGRSTSREGLIEDRNSSGSTFNVGLNMPVFDGFKILNTISARKLNLMAATEALNKAKDDVAVGVASYFLQVLYNKEIMNIAELQVNLTKEQVTRTEALVSAGKVPMSQLYDIKAQLAKDAVTLIETQNNVKLALLDLAQTLELERLAENFDIERPELNDAVTDHMGSVLPPDLIYDNAVLVKPQIKEQEYLLESQRKMLKVAQADYYPSLNLGASYSNGYYRYFGSDEIITKPFSDQFKENAQRGIGLNLNIPIFNRFSIRNNVRQARVGIINRELMMENSKKTLYKEIQQAYYNSTAALEKYMASEKSVTASKEAFSYAEERYATGKSTVFEYNDSKTKYAQSLSEQAQSKYNYIFRVKILDFYNGIPISL
ncbi:MAG: TolC family protein [Tannerella sp.]|nr:TolC family protein [Tannerella sp.]